MQQKTPHPFQEMGVKASDPYLPSEQGNERPKF